MKREISIIGIIVKNLSAVDTLNNVLHKYSEFIIGRMGLPYKERDINLISISVDADVETTNRLKAEIESVPEVIANSVCYDVEF
ncbi:MAG: hypothetical protein Q4B14_02890 [Clostridia bacterium]|nr:hypothetical protein [Clostridia bacterium]